MNLEILPYKEVDRLLTFVNNWARPSKVDWKILKEEPWTEIPFKRRSFSFDLSWTGKVLNMKEDSILPDIFHEAAHYILSGELKEYPDFGLGAGFSTRANPQRVVETEVAEYEELVACFIEWCFMKKYNMTDNEVGYIMQHESFNDFKFSEQEYKKVLNTLEEREPLFAEHGITLEFPYEC